MINTKNAMDIINNYSEKVKDDKKKLAEAMAERKTKIFNSVYACADKVRNLIEIGNAILSKGIPLGPKKSMPMTGAGTLQSDWWYHNFGYITRGDKVVAIGNIAGGACGEINVEYDGDEHLVYPNVNCLEGFATNLDEFEKKVEDYLNELAKKANA